MRRKIAVFATFFTPPTPPRSCHAKKRCVHCVLLISGSGFLQSAFVALAIAIACRSEAPTRAAASKIFHSIPYLLFVRISKRFELRQCVWWQMKALELQFQTLFLFLKTVDFEGSYAF